MKNILPIVALTVYLSGCGGKTNEKVIIIEATAHELINTPVYVDVDMAFFINGYEICLEQDGEIIPGQVENITGDKKRIWWMANVKKGDSARYVLKAGSDCYDKTFGWKALSDNSRLLSLGDKALIQYEFPVFNPDSIEDTKKPFHHVYDPAGTGLITKGLGGLYPHHRGIFFGYNRVQLSDENMVDIWHANEGERSEHEEMISEFSGPVMGGNIARIFWKDREGAPFISERREVRVFRQNDSEILIDFHSTLTAIEQSVMLDGDLQHAGVQFRASQYVADNPGQTRFIRPAKWAHLDPAVELAGEDFYGLPWDAMYFNVDSKPFTVAYFSHPGNPGNAQMSERLYGRFGAFFPYQLEPENPLKVHYRFWIISGDKPSVEQIQKQYDLFVYNPEKTIEDQLK